MKPSLKFINCFALLFFLTKTHFAEIASFIYHYVVNSEKDGGILKQAIFPDVSAVKKPIHVPNSNKIVCTSVLNGRKRTLVYNSGQNKMSTRSVKIPKGILSAKKFHFSHKQRKIHSEQALKSLEILLLEAS